MIALYYYQPMHHDFILPQSQFKMEAVWRAFGVASNTISDFPLKMFTAFASHRKTKSFI